MAIPLMLALVSCSGGGSRKPITEEYFFDNFKNVVASADRDGYTPYWLGRNFTAGGLTFTGPHVDDLPGAKVVGGGVAMSYDAATPGTPGRSGGAVGFDLRVYSPAAWAKDRDRVDVPATKYVRVAGQDAKLSVVAAGTRPVNSVWLVLQFEETTVLASAHAGGAATPGGPDANPLIDEATFFAVMEKIRPYPE